ncbi:MAG TPA: 23S rRNA (pseudouridine(1915)-N(3))-methyltransferase RlmH [Candidatus Polarisedimenticolaceae bacterium]|nr:23S rRNA (pseudouridine(1915)-N(3))-methyltransferase RlmH [Candidatus Polarisedimenticolaceae bacterium]
MRLRLLVVGRPRDPSAILLHDDYAARLQRLGLHYRSDSVAGERAGSHYSDAHVREREGRALLAAMEPGEKLIALDPGGSHWSSEELAERIEGWGTPAGCLAIGGPLGLAPALLERAHVRWSLSRLTFPHELVRVLVAEQLYRALSILRGLPYHRGSP